MKITKGILGIRRILKENAIGWHIFADNEYVGYRHLSLADILDSNAPCTLVGVTGNGLHFERHNRNLRNVNIITKYAILAAQSDAIVEGTLRG